MNKEDIIRMAREAQMPFYWRTGEITYLDKLERFAALVAKHTLLNLDPSSFMSWQEGYEAGKQTEREACAKVADTISDKYGWGHYGNEVDTADEIAAAIRARGQA